MYYAQGARLTFLLAAPLLFAGSVVAQEVGYNDLTGLGANPLKHSKFRPDSSCKGEGGGVLGIGCPPETYPFELALMTVEGTELAIDGEVNVALRLSNMGRESALVPWFTDPEQIELPDDNGRFEFSQIDLRADISQEGGRSAHISIPVHLYGTRKVPGSLQEIRPGEYVEIGVKLVLDSKNEELRFRSLKTGPARLSFSWTEWDSRVVYERCNIQTRHLRIRQLTSDATDMSVVGGSASE
jgi:hypothetical protein